MATDSSEVDASAVPAIGATVLDFADSVADFFASSLIPWSLLAEAVSSLLDEPSSFAVADEEGWVVAADAFASAGWLVGAAADSLGCVLGDALSGSSDAVVRGVAVAGAVVGVTSLRIERRTKLRIPLLSDVVTSCPVICSFSSIASMNFGLRFVAQSRSNLAAPRLGFGLVISRRAASYQPSAMRS